MRIIPTKQKAMKTEELYNALNDEQKRLYDHLEENDYRIYLFEQDGQICAEVENWTDGGVDMIITLMPFIIDELQNYYDNFDIDDEIDLHRQDERYRAAFRITASVRDFTDWEQELERVICEFNSKAA